MGTDAHAETYGYSLCFISRGVVATRIRGVGVLLAVAKGDESWKERSIGENHQHGDLQKEGAVDTNLPNGRRSVERRTWLYQ